MEGKESVGERECVSERDGEGNRKERGRERESVCLKEMGRVIE